MDGYVELRSALGDRIHRVLEGDPRVAAAWLAGSFGRGEADAWSDLDLWVTVRDAAFEGFLADLPRLYARVGKPILLQRPIPANAPPGGFFQLVLFDGALEVDWTVVPLSRAQRPAACQVLFAQEKIPPAEPQPLSVEALQERLDFFWAMAPIGLKYVARRDTARAVGNIGLLRDAYSSVLNLLGDDITSVPRLAETITPRDCLEMMRQLWAAMEQLHPRLQALGLTVPSEVPAAVRRLASLAITP